MSTSTSFKKLAVCTIITGLFTISQATFAHTSLQVGTINENTATYNNVVIGHGCAPIGSTITSNPVIAQSVVFPDGIDSSITNAAGTAMGGVITDYVTNWITVGATAGTGFGAKIKNTDVFTKEGLKLANGSPDRVGFYGLEGELEGVGYVGLNPFRTAKVIINPTSCAKSVTFKMAVADICKATKFPIPDGAANIWMPAGTGSSFDSLALDGYGSAPSLKVVRTSILPPACGAGVDVIVTPSGAQIDHDLPIVKKNGEQYWPKKSKSEHDD
ncbi:MAG: hypothetical protein QX189_06360 [Methylococcales bacterium]